VCASFLRQRDNHGLQPFDPQGRSLYMPYGTALRMGDLGYNSDAQKNLQVCYNSLQNYIETLRSAIMQPHPDYRDIPSGEGGNYQQLSDGLLQIENEFYSPIRPKRVTRSGETPLNALHRAGIEYVEVRCIDVSPFHPAGLDARQIRFLDTFLLFCLLQESPPCDDDEQAMQRTNLEAVVNRGRQPGLVLKTSSGERDLAQWAGELLSGMELVARELDEAHDCADYVLDLQAQQAKVEDPELTPSARILREMREQDLPFFRLAMGYSKRWAEHYRTRQLPQAEKVRFEEESKRSLRAQREIESSDDISFERYLDNFFSQYRAL
jgi:glutamate--cysteine ligase